MQILLVDNHDSFSAILCHYLWELTGNRPLFHLNDALTREELKALRFDAAVLSPGPGRPSRPRDFGICADLLELYPQLPILGVCLGHQGLAEFAGGKVVPLHEARHGRPSAIRHDGEGLFKGLPQGFQAIRYHSLVVEQKSLPEKVQVTAWSEEDGRVMGLRFKDRPWFGVQIHPESIGTEHGKKLLANFLEVIHSKKKDLERLTSSSTDLASISPDFGDFSRKSRDFENSKIFFRYRKLASWLDPASVFLRHFATANRAFWLDGSHATSKAGWPATYMGCAESDFRFDGDFNAFRTRYDALRLTVSNQVPWPGYCGGPLGHFAYELYRQTLNVSTPNDSGKSSQEPMGRWMLPDGYLVFNHSEKQVFAAWEGEMPPVWLQTLMDKWETIPSEESEPMEASLPPFREWKPLLSQDEYKGRVEKIQDAIAAGETYEACLTHGFSAAAKADALAVFLRLRARNPSPYAAYMAFPDLKLLSLSPELFLELSPEGVLRSRPMKGTRPRGATKEEDENLKRDLAGHPKDCAENRMIVDLTRHDFCRVCAVGSVRVPSFLEVETHPAVFQLVSEVRGKLAGERHPLDAVKACFPGGSMTGAPKERTVELLSALEAEPRGAFSGALGYFTYGGAFNLSMVIRTLENRGDAWRVGCGGAVLADSDPEAEWREATLKARSVIDAAATEKK